MTREEHIVQIKKKQSFLCVGLDTDLKKVPNHLLKLEDPVFEFNKQIIDMTKDFCVAYKTNIAFYESIGVNGWISLQKTLDYIPTMLCKEKADFSILCNSSFKYSLLFPFVPPVSIIIVCSNSCGNCSAKSNKA